MGCNVESKSTPRKRNEWREDFVQNVELPHSSGNGLEWATRRAKSPVAALGPGLSAVAQGDRGRSRLRREGDAVTVAVEKRQAGGTQALRICGEIELAAMIPASGTAPADAAADRRPASDCRTPPAIVRSQAVSSRGVISPPMRNVWCHRPRFDDDVIAFFSPHAEGKSAIFLVALGHSAKAGT